MAKKKSSRAIVSLGDKNQKDDLTRIEGIGPTVATLLRGEGIETFAKLSRTSQTRLKKILSSAGGRYSKLDPNTWHEQAALARDGAWEKLKILQKELKQGKRVKPYSLTASSQSSQTRGSSSIPVVLSAVGGGSFVAGEPFIIERLLTPEEEIAEFELRRDELMPEFAKANKAAKSLWRLLKKLPEFEGHITGISVRYRTKLGHPVSPLRVVVAVNVAQKLSEIELSARNYTDIKLCSKELAKKDQHEVKVLEGEFDLLEARPGFFLAGSGLPSAALPFTSNISGGIPINQPNQPVSNYGTLGIVSVANGRAAIGLTAQHVVGTDTIVKQINAAGDRRDLGQVTVLKNAPHDVKIGADTESIDAAALEILSNATISLPGNGEWARGINSNPFFDPSLGSLPVFYSNRRVNAGDKGRRLIIKFGNGSGVVTRGKIDNLFQTSMIQQKQFLSNFTIAPLDNSNGPFVTPGDSGSIVATQAKSVNNTPKDAWIIIGILFAGLKDSTRGIACSMSYIIKGLDLKNNLTGSEFADDWS